MKSLKKYAVSVILIVALFFSVSTQTLADIEKSKDSMIPNGESITTTLLPEMNEAPEVVADKLKATSSASGGGKIPTSVNNPQTGDSGKAQLVLGILLAVIAVSVAVLGFIFLKNRKDRKGRKGRKRRKRRS